MTITKFWDFVADCAFGIFQSRQTGASNVLFFNLDASRGECDGLQGDISTVWFNTTRIEISRQISSTLQVGENARVYRGFRGAQGPNSEVSSSSSAVVHKAVYFVSDFLEFSLFGEHVPCLLKVTKYFLTTHHFAPALYNVKGQFSKIVFLAVTFDKCSTNIVHAVDVCC